MTVIRVNPGSILAYADSANAIFDSVRSSLDALVAEAVGVNYKGENAVEFKTECGRMAVDFANALNADIQAIASAVSASTSAISASLGGQPVTLDVNVQPFEMPAVPASDGSVELDTSGLSALSDSAASHFESIGENVADHLASLQATDWEGGAKDNAVSAISTYTGQGPGDGVDHADPDPGVHHRPGRRHRLRRRLTGRR